MANKLKRFLTGKTRLGQVVYGVVDALPIPNLLNIPRAVLGANPQATSRELLNESWAKIDKVRLAVGVFVSYLILSGNMTIDKAGEFANVLLGIIG
jgi:hypothetical protein